MRIAIDARTIEAERTGLGEYVQELVRGLGRIAPHHRYLLFGREGMVPPMVPLVDTLQPNVEYRSTKATPSDRYRRDFWENIVLPRALGRWNADLFHSPAWLLPLRPMSRATVITIHDTTHFKFPGMHNRLIGYRFRLRATRSVALADAIIAISESTKRDIIGQFRVDEERVVVVHNGVNERFSPEPDSDGPARLLRLGVREPYILSVGTLEPRKNHLGLIHAFEHIAEEYPDVDLVLAGRPGWLYEPILQAVERSPYQRRIRLLHYVSDDDLPELYRRAQVMAYPSFYEGFGSPPLEALASGTPVLTSRCSSLPEVVGDAAVLVDPNRIDEISQGLSALISNPGLRQKHRAAGLQQASRFSWSRAAAQTLGVYEMALERYKGRRLTARSQ